MFFHKIQYLVLCLWAIITQDYDYLLSGVCDIYERV